MKKYIICEGLNYFYSDSKDVRKHMRDGGAEKVTVLDAKTREIICEAVRCADGRIVRL